MPEVASLSITMSDQPSHLVRAKSRSISKKKEFCCLTGVSVFSKVWKVSRIDLKFFTT